MHNEEADGNTAETPIEIEEKDLNETPIIEKETEKDAGTALTDSVEGVEEAAAETAQSKKEITSTVQDAPPAEEAEAEKLADESVLNETVAAKDEVSEQVSVTVDAAEDEQAAKLESPIFKELAAPKLPRLAPENRARLQMQSPTRIFFYWSIKNNPYQTLHKALGGQAQNYRLVAKLVNVKNGKEEIYPVEAEGSWWFNVEAGGDYRVDVGFYALNRPFVRLVFSNTVETPRTAPSPNLDQSPAFAVSASDFAEALDASGYRQDAFDIVIAGDGESADEATNAAFEQIAGNVFDPAKFAAAELRYVLYALASGASLEDLRAEMTPLLFDYLVNILEQQPDALDAENVLPVWESNFGSEHAEEMQAQRLSATVFGASLINFPRISGRRKPKLSPVSSLR